MLTRLRQWLANRGDRAPARPVPTAAAAPAEIRTTDGIAFAIAAHLHRHEGFPILDWPAVHAWVDSLPAPQRPTAWLDAERAWLAHVREALGVHFRVDESKRALLVSSYEPNLAAATLKYLDHTLDRVVRVLEGIARIPDSGKTIMIVFDDVDAYYRYVSYYYPDDGSYAFSGGMCIAEGCAHLVTVKADLSVVEATIAHEMTHACVAHLPLPAWLNEGLAVNAEERITGRRTFRETPDELRRKHRRFWDAARIQEFWAGDSFYRTDDGQLLSYDLARIMVDELAADWPAFTRFALAADRADAGAASAQAQLGVELGAVACALLERPRKQAWAPDPQHWRQEAAPAAAPHGVRQSTAPKRSCPSSV